MQPEVAGQVEERGRGELAVHHDVVREASAHRGHRALQQPLAGAVLAVPRSVGLDIEGQREARADHRDEAAAVQVAVEVALGIPEGMAERAAGRRAASRAGAVEGEADEIAALERLVPLGLPEGRGQRHPGGPRGEPLGEVGQGVIPEAPGDPQGRARR